MAGVNKRTLMPLVELYRALVPLCRCAGRERAKVAASAGLRILLAGVDAVFAGRELPDHGVRAAEGLLKD